MKTRHMFRSKFGAFAVAFTIAIPVACSYVDAPTKKNQRTITDVQPSPQKEKEHSADASFQILNPRPKVSALKIDNGEFRLNGFRVGLEDYMTSQSPVLNWFLPEDADYIAIMRCTSDTIIQGTFDNLHDVDLGSANLEDEVKIFQANDFWDAAKSSRGCTVISTNTTGKSYLDNNTPVGPTSFRYLARVCVSLERLTNADLIGNRNCSKMVAFSNLLQDYQNERIEKERLALERVTQLRDKVDGLGRYLYYKTIELNNALSACQEAEEDRVFRVKQKQAITNILGFGISLAGNLLVPEDGLSAVQAGKKTFKTLAEETWKDRDQILGSGANIGTALNWLFSSPNDYPRSCTEAQKLANDGKTITSEIKSAHMQFAQAMDDAEAARRARLGVEK